MMDLWRDLVEVQRDLVEVQRGVVEEQKKMVKVEGEVMQLQRLKEEKTGYLYAPIKLKNEVVI